MIKTIGCWGALAALLSGCASSVQAPPNEDWRLESIVDISVASALPSYVDRHCLDGLASASRQDSEALMLYFRVGRARYYQAFPDTPDDGWKVGDKAMFDSDTCKIRRPGKTIR